MKKEDFKNSVIILLARNRDKTLFESATYHPVLDRFDDKDVWYKETVIDMVQGKWEDIYVKEGDHYTPVEVIVDDAGIKSLVSHSIDKEVDNINYLPIKALKI